MTLYTQKQYKDVESNFSMKLDGCGWLDYRSSGLGIARARPVEDNVEWEGQDRANEARGEPAYPAQGRLGWDTNGSNRWLPEPPPMAVRSLRVVGFANGCGLRRKANPGSRKVAVCYAGRYYNVILYKFLQLPLVKRIESSCRGCIWENKERWFCSQRFCCRWARWVVGWPDANSNRRELINLPETLRISFEGDWTCSVGPV